MCMSCVSQTDALFWNGAIAGSVALGGLARARAALTGHTHQRRQDTDRADREFLASLGLDPDEVLGAAPTP